MYVSFFSPACMHICLYVCIHACMHAGQMMTNVGHASWKQYSCSTAKGGSSEKKYQPHLGSMRSVNGSALAAPVMTLLQHHHLTPVLLQYWCQPYGHGPPTLLQFWWPLRSWRHMQLRDIQSVAAWAIQRKKHRKKQSKINQRPYLCSYC